MKRRPPYIVVMVLAMIATPFAAVILATLELLTAPFKYLKSVHNYWHNNP